MKHTPALMTDALTASEFNGLYVARCLNLRPDTHAVGLTPVDEPAQVCRSGLKPFHTQVMSNGRKYLFVFDRNTMSVSVISPDGRFTEIGTLPDTPRSVAALHGRLLVYTDRGNALIYPVECGDWRMTSALPDLNGIMLRSYHAGNISAAIGATDLKGNYQRCQGTLDAADTRTVTDLMLNAYNDIARRAAAAGLDFQPRLMAWRITDCYGQTVACSVPVLVSSPTATFAATGQINATLAKDSSGSFSQMGETELTAPLYGVKLEIPAFATVKGIYSWFSRLEVLSTPPLHPVNYTENADTRLTADSSAQGQLTIAMPGTSVDMASSHRARRALIEGALQRFHSMATVIYRVNRPLECSEARSIQLSLPQSGVPSAISAAVRNAMSRPVDRVDNDIAAQCSVPNDFVAGTITESGDTVLLADIAPLRFPGHLPEIYAVETEHGSFRQMARTEMADGNECVVVSGQSADGEAPAAFSPLIVSPHADATSLTLRVAMPDGTVKSRRFPLVASPCGRYAYYLADSLTKQQLTDTDPAYVIPAATGSRPVLHGTLMTARAGCPYAPVGIGRISHGTILRITKAAGGGSAWNFARQHLIVWASDGIYSLSVDASRKHPGTSLMHRTGVCRRDAVAVAPNAIYAVLSDGSVASMQGSRIEPLMKGGTAVAAGYEPHGHELWLLTDCGDNLVVPLQRINGYYARNSPSVSEFSGCADSLLANGEDGTFDLSDCRAPGHAIEVEYQARWKMTSRQRLKWLKWMIQAPGADITASWLMDGGAGTDNAYPLLSLQINGPVNSPVCARLAAWALPYLTFEVTGRLTTHSTAGPIEIL